MLWWVAQAMPAQGVVAQQRRRISAFVKEAPPTLERLARASGLIPGRLEKRLPFMPFDRFMTGIERAGANGRG